MKKIVFISLGLILVLVGIGGIFLYNRYWKGSARAAQNEQPTVTVERGNLIATISTSGTVALPNQQKLSFGVSGTIKEVKVENGSVVKKGDMLALLDTLPLERDLDKAQDNLANAEINLKKLENLYKPSDLIRAEAAIVSAKTSLLSAEKSLKDYMELYTETDKALAEGEIRNARKNLENAQVALDLKLRSAVTKEKRSYAQEIQDAMLAREKALKDYKKLIWGKQAIYNLESIIADTDYHLKLNPKKLGFITEEAFDIRVENAYWAWINADISLQNLLKEAEDAEKTLQNNVQKAKDDLKKAEEKLADIAKWPEAKEVDLRKNQIESAKFGLQRAEADLADIKAGADPLDIEIRKMAIQQSKTSLEVAKENLEKARLLAPFDGVIFNLTAEPGQSISPGTIVMQIVDPSKVRIDALVDEVDVARVRNEQEVELAFDALPGIRLTGKVSAVSYVAQKQSGITNFLTSIVMDTTGRPAAERQVRPQGTMERPDTKQGKAGDIQRQRPSKMAKPGQIAAKPGEKRGAAPSARGGDRSASADKRGAAPQAGQRARPGPILREGMTSLITIIVEERQGVLTVPGRAIVTVGRISTVKVLAGDKAEDRRVRVGITDGSRTEIISGLEEGELLLAQPPRVRSTPAKPGMTKGMLGF